MFDYQSIMDTLFAPPIITAGQVVLLLLLAWATRFYVEPHLVRAIDALTTRLKWEWTTALQKHQAFHRLAQIVPPLLIHFCIPLIPDLAPDVVRLIRNISSALVILFGGMAINATLNAACELYSTGSRARTRSIKSYFQIAKLICSVTTALIIISILIDKSPVILLSGVGAMSAVLLLVFRDTLLSFVASLQLSSNDMLRVGDWIEMPQVGADGDVVDIALHSIKVQNWDNTITTIPTWRLISESFKNWRGMQQSGGRRIKRCVRLDTHTIEFLRPEFLATLPESALVHRYKDSRGLKDSRVLPGSEDLSHEFGETNLGAFRHYALGYLQRHPDIHPTMICMVRAMEPGSEGVPVEIYCFTKGTDWLEYERIQGEIFDHLLAILPEFGLLLFQQPSGADMRRFLQR